MKTKKNKGFYYKKRKKVKATSSGPTIMNIRPGRNAVIEMNKVLKKK